MRKYIKTTLSMNQFSLIAAFVFFSSLPAISQNNPLPINHPVLTAAPNLPTVFKFSGNTNGLRYTAYLTEHEESFVKQWALSFPEEVKKYKAAISTYLKDSNPSELPEDERVLYYDLQAQLPKVTEYCLNCD
ncbi:hypothetical protein ABID22_002168 [Pontibacter aydingkolensis]|uniref:GLPGLI family protein n=1 Tax=Pontibacter aydingkolensis TaxID=1911536 RepID=A0ABS7CV86_9BACT|nr:hypothetical protein [Pontibacter aydingkolensis]MBW7467778.1 hypothetical protein [Pontibacter aydingkolensis]